MASDKQVFVVCFLDVFPRIISEVGLFLKKQTAYTSCFQTEHLWFLTLSRVVESGRVSAAVPAAGSPGCHRWAHAVPALWAHVAPEPRASRAAGFGGDFC